MTDPVESFLDALGRVRRAQQTSRDLVGDRWKEVSPRLRAEPVATEQAPTSLEPRGLDLAGLTELQAQELGRDLAGAADLLAGATVSARELSRLLGVGEPVSLAGVTALCDLAALSAVPHRPLEACFSPEGLAKAQREAVGIVAAAVREFEDRRDRTVAACVTAQEHAGPGWEDMPPHLPRQPEAAEEALGVLEPPGADLTVLGRDEAGSLASRWGAFADMLENAAQCAVDAAHLLGCGLPVTVWEVRSVANLVVLSTAAHRAADAWFDPAVLPRARQVVGELRVLMDTRDQAQQAARGSFGPATPHTAGLTDAARRLSENGRRFAAGLSTQVRADRKLVGGASNGGSWQSALQQDLDKAAAWQQAHQAVRAKVAEQKVLLGAHAGDDLADLDALVGALRQAEDAHRLAPAVMAAPIRRRRLVAQLAHGFAPDAELHEWGERLRSAIGPSGSSPDWLTLSGARASLAAVVAARVTKEDFLRSEAENRRLLGGLYEGITTSRDTVHSALDWNPHRQAHRFRHRRGSTTDTRGRAPSAAHGTGCVGQAPHPRLAGPYGSAHRSLLVGAGG
ncbi:hypothetical protein ACFW5W_03825 [Streptomyces sp. NPDC058783]|uniref:hypothetical protein n=1 Tax=unclassified Streptomyces TaxID=2593676 RepID=UPI003655DF00